VIKNEFSQLGDSAIVSVGRSEGMDGTKPTYPNRNSIVANHIHDFGLYGKQTSCYFQVRTLILLLGLGVQSLIQI
jgi:hypothetical protein